MAEEIVVSKLLVFLVTLGVGAALAPQLVEAQPAQAGNCSTVSVTAGGLTLVIAGNRSKRSLEQYILKNNLPLGLLTTTCTGAGLSGVRPSCTSSAIVCSPSTPAPAAPVK